GLHSRPHRLCSVAYGDALRQSLDVLSAQPPGPGVTGYGILDDQRGTGGWSSARGIAGHSAPVHEADAQACHFPGPAPGARAAEAVEEAAPRQELAAAPGPHGRTGFDGSGTGAAQ